jgi:hypothetical protein
LATQADIADLIRRRFTVGRVQPGVNNYLYVNLCPSPHIGPALPTIQQIANDLLADAEFKGLQLGGFLNTPTGEFLEQAVQMIVPRALSPEFELIVAGLKLAADRQQGEKWGKALLAVGGSLLAGAVLKEISVASRGPAAA